MESMAMCYNAYLFTLLIPPAILTFINADLGPDPRYTWITISWNLGGAMFVTIGGRLSDIFGRRYFFLAGSALLILGSIVSATGQNINQMIAGGAIFGAGSGFLEMSFGAVQVTAPIPNLMCANLERKLSLANTAMLPLGCSMRPHSLHSSCRLLAG